MQHKAVDEAGGLLRDRGFQTRDQNLLHVEADLALHGTVHFGLAELPHGGFVAHVAQTLRHKFVMLGAKDDGVNFHGLVRLPVILNGELALGIRAQVRHEPWFVVADIGEDFQQFVAQVQRKGHVVLRIPAGITEHHALVAGALLFLRCPFHAAVDVGRLFVEGTQHTAAGSVKHVIGLGVADAADGVTDRGLDVHVGFRLHFAHHHHHAGGTETLAGHLRFRILHQELIQDGVRNLVCHFVGMPFAHRLACKQIVFHCHCSFVIPGSVIAFFVIPGSDRESL